MTACFGIGQIVGPLVANAMYAPHHSFSGSLETAASALAVAGLFCIRLSKPGQGSATVQHRH
jgi:hypothetical protein